MEISVILCTYNPNVAYLDRTLAGLEAQTLPKTNWELLIVDNRSNEPLSARCDLSWHPNSRIVVEPTLGLTPARLRGIRETTGNIIVFVDDDNVLDSQYLEVALQIARDFPWIGAFGGSIEGEFATEPPVGGRFLLPHLALRQVDAAQWACLPGIGALDVSPWGAGMVIRREVVLAYACFVQEDPLRAKLDRVGEVLSSAGDSDMALCSCAKGLAVGLFPSLHLRHLIPAKRLEMSYLLRLAEGNAYSHAILRYLWERKLPAAPVEPRPSYSERVFNCYKVLRLKYRRDQPSFPQEVCRVEEGARARARRFLLSLDPEADPASIHPPHSPLHTRFTPVSKKNQ